MAHEFYKDIAERAARRNRMWYQQYLLKALHAAKEAQAREIDASIALAEKLMEMLDEPVEPPTEVPMPEVIPTEEDYMMKPVEPHVLALLHESTEKGGVYKYLKERYKKPPEDKFLYRVATSWDYGWMQKEAKQRARDVNHGRSFMVRHTFYRKNNLAPDPPHYAQPSGGQVSICSEYSCNFN